MRPSPVDNRKDFDVLFGDAVYDAIGSLQEFAHLRAFCLGHPRS
ncbi:MAG TPA: hypothetical protein VF722_09045 [Gemmatimonadaceae bacterium]